MTCEHLAPLEEALLEAGLPVTFRGQPWSHQTREWVYFGCVLDPAGAHSRFGLAPCVRVHEHVGTHDGAEAGLVCTLHHDGVMGIHPLHAAPGTPRFPPPP